MEIELEKVIANGILGLCNECDHIYPVVTAERIKPFDTIKITNDPRDYRLIHHHSYLTKALCAGSGTEPIKLVFEPNVAA